MADLTRISQDAELLTRQSARLSGDIKAILAETTTNVPAAAIDPFIFGITVFVLACFVGYYVVWKVTPALHTPLMSLTNAISGIIIVGAMIATGAEGFGLSAFYGFFAVIIAAINIFGGFIVTYRMLQMFRKK
jgi:NAD(P) transhydrogenase subunit alpha